MQPLNSLVGPRPANTGGTSAAHLTGVLRYPFTILALLWFAGIVMVNVFDKDLWEMMLFLAIFVPWVFVGGGVILVLTIAGLHLRSSVHRSEAFMSMGIFFAGLITHFGAGSYLSMNIRFLIARHHYEQRLAKISTYSAPYGVDYRGRDVAGVERGIPVRVAFYWVKGFGPDNWVGLVHDPSGEVMQAMDFRLNPSAVFDPTQDKVRGLFGGDLYATRHLTGDWYLCWFT